MTQVRSITWRLFTNYIQTPESYTFTLVSQGLISPFQTPVAFGTTTLLQTVTMPGLALHHGFEYLQIAPNSTGELTKVVTPYAGELRWDHRSFTYINSRTL